MTEESRVAIKAKLDAIKVFMETTAYVNYVKDYARDITALEQSILLGRPTDLTSQFALIELYGRLDECQRAANFFEDARANLETLLDEAVESEQQMHENIEMSNDNETQSDNV